jgi:trans-2,3-dihydro-3-hydroxyanthranilate isomerase
VKAFSYLHYDVFTGEALLGNQLAVFTDARGMETAVMQRVAREMNFSESTFLLPAEQPGTDVRMRIFTPNNEMPMAGHPTIGSTFALAETGAIAPGSGRFVFGLNIGPTPVDLEWQGSRLRFAWMTQPLPAFGAEEGDRGAVAAALGLGAGDLADGLPVQEVSCGVTFLVVPLRSKEVVDRAISDASAVRRLAASRGTSLPVFLFAMSPAGSAETVYSRMFAPDFGIPEDPATGSASGPLGCYLVRYGLVTADAAGRIVSLQGAAMGRASRIHIAIGGSAAAIAAVKVGGEAILVGRGELYL